MSKCMIREIKFRGKRIETGEWVYGYLTVYSDGTPNITTQADREIQQWIKSRDGKLKPFYAIYSTTYDVEPETVGQYTGIKAEDGTEIYEGDIIEVSGGLKGVVKFKNGCFYLALFSEDEEYCKCICLQDWSCKRVLGNIFENPTR